MPTLVLIDGPPGVGKSTVLPHVRRALDRCACLDADDVRRVSPCEADERTLLLAEERVVAALRGHLEAKIPLVLLFWVLANPDLVERVLGGVDGLYDSLLRLDLVASRSHRGALPPAPEAWPPARLRPSQAPRDPGPAPPEDRHHRPRPRGRGRPCRGRGPEVSARRSQREWDAYGRIIHEHYRGRGLAEIIERDDGYFATSAGAPAYFAPFEEWPAPERRAMHHVRGRVLDVGCGAGRVALHLQARGHEVVGIDLSPLAIETCRLRGVRDARVLPVTRVSRRLGRFDTLVMFGNNFGLLGGWRRGRWLLRRFHALTAPGARILAESRNPYRTRQREHSEYQRRNRRRGRLPGQLRIRVRCGRAGTPWFDYLIVSPREMRALVAGTGWRVARVLDAKEAVYVAVLEKTAG